MCNTPTMIIEGPFPPRAINPKRPTILALVALVPSLMSVANRALFPDAGGMLLTLMMAHMAGHVYMRGRLQVLLQRRAVLQSVFDRWGLPQPASLAIDIKAAAGETQV